jgi:hypothetical protein
MQLVDQTVFTQRLVTPTLVFLPHICFRRDTVLADKPFASGPINIFKASPISPLDMPFRYSHGTP